MRAREEAVGASNVDPLRDKVEGRVEDVEASIEDPLRGRLDFREDADERETIVGREETEDGRTLTRLPDFGKELIGAGRTPGDSAIDALNSAEAIRARSCLPVERESVLIDEAVDMVDLGLPDICDARLEPEPDAELEPVSAL